MRGLKRNLKNVYYALYNSETALKDEYGNETSEIDIENTTPTMIEVSISAGTGTVDVEIFGKAINYEKILIVFDENCPIDEYSVLWIDQTDTKKAYDYIVNGIAKSLNHTIIAVSKVNVSA